MTGTSRSKAELLAILRAHEPEFRARGVQAMTVFGSLARGEARSMSDIDVAIRPGEDFSSGGFDYFEQMETLRTDLAEILGCDVDLVEETAASPRLRKVIAEEGERAF